MKLKKFLEKHPECDSYRIEIAYCDHGRAAYYTHSLENPGLSELCPPFGGHYTTVRVVHVNHENKTVWVVYGNV